MKPSTPYHPHLHEELKDPVFALNYLNACIDEYDKGVFLLALKHVVDAHGGMAKLAKKTKLNREHLFRLLSKNGNPELKTLQKIAKALGWKVGFLPKTEIKEAA